MNDVIVFHHKGCADGIYASAMLSLNLSSKGKKVTNIPFTYGNDIGDVLNEFLKGPAPIIPMHNEFLKESTPKVSVYFVDICPTILDLEKLHILGLCTADNQVTIIDHHIDQINTLLTDAKYRSFLDIKINSDSDTHSVILHTNPEDNPNNLSGTGLVYELIKSDLEKLDGGSSLGNLAKYVSDYDTWKLADGNWGHGLGLRALLDVMRVEEPSDVDLINSLVYDFKRGSVDQLLSQAVTLRNVEFSNSTKFLKNNHGFIRVYAHPEFDKPLHVCFGYGMNFNEDVASMLYGASLDGDPYVCMFHHMTKDMGVSMYKQQIKLSIRSGNGAECLNLAKALGGGGHPEACGCRIHKPHDRSIIDVMHEFVYSDDLLNKVTRNN